MSDSEFFLSSSTRALAGSNDAIHLIEQKERVEQAVVSNDPALTLDTAKAFLESIFKTILSDRVTAPNLEQDLSPLYRSVRDVLPLNRDEAVNDILKKLTNSIVHSVAELRNNYGAASHGDDGYFENPIEMPEAEMVARVVDGMAGFLFLKHKAHGNPELAARIYYGEYPEFDDFLDNQWEGYELPLSTEHNISLPASKIIFLSDPSAYREMLLQYLSSENDDQDE
ncbi:MAG: abortive infection family protein [Gallionella sp.]|nr:abortive infection family protein [Gallionella sp.]MCK9354042.1 abortive infection family protein [Gallionella sp.]